MAFIPNAFHIALYPHTGGRHNILVPFWSILEMHNMYLLYVI